jgi:hypothetical protein
MEQAYIQRILELCLKVNANTANAAFFSYSGHVDSISVSVNGSKVDGYELDELDETKGMPKYRFQCYLSGSLRPANLENKLKDVIENLEAITLGE